MLIEDQDTDLNGSDPSLEDDPNTVDDQQTDDPDADPSDQDDPNADPSDADPVMSRFRELGLDADRYADPEDVVRKLTNQDATLTQLQQEQATQRRENEQLRNIVANVVGARKETAPPQTADEFVEQLQTQGADAIRGAGFVSTEDLNQQGETVKSLQMQLGRLQIADMLSGLDAKSDLGEAAQYIRANAASRQPIMPPPGTSKTFDRLVAAIPLDSPMWEDPRGLALAYRGLMASAPTPTKVTMIPDSKKDRAKTTAGKSKQKSTDPDFKGMTADEMEAYLKKTGQWGG